MADYDREVGRRMTNIKQPLDFAVNVVQHAHRQQVVVGFEVQSRRQANHLRRQGGKDVKG